jgi:hypothetical protein
MKLVITIPTLALVACFGAAALSGCGNGQDRTAATRKASASVPADVAKARSELDQVQGALRDLRDAKGDADLKQLYGSLKSHSKGLDGSLADVSSSGDASVAAGKDQIEQWHRQNDTFADADLRNASAKREGDLRQAVDALAVSNAALKGSGDSYRSQLSQTIAALDLDLTPAGVSTVSPVIGKLVDDDAKLRASLVDIADKSERVTAVVGPVVR